MGALTLLDHPFERFEHPFPHVVGHAPCDLPFPEIDGLKPNETKRINAVDVLADQAYEPWHELFRRHTDEAFFRQVAALFPHETSARRKIDEDSRITLRHSNEPGDFVTECQFVVNAPGPGPFSATHGPHLDSPHVVYALCWYLRDPRDRCTGAGFQMWRSKEGTEPRSNLGQVAPRWLVGEPKTVPYEHGTFVLFPTLGAVHGMQPRNGATVPRRYINIIAETT